MRKNQQIDAGASGGGGIFISNQEQALSREWSDLIPIDSMRTSSTKQDRKLTQFLQLQARSMAKLNNAISLQRRNILLRNQQANQQEASRNTYWARSMGREAKDPPAENLHSVLDGTGSSAGLSVNERILMFKQ